MMNRRRWGYLGLAGCGLLFLPLLVPTFRSVYNADESLLFFVVSHPLWHRSFWESIGSMIAGMPWFFVEYWFYIRGLMAALGETTVTENLELLGRLPMIYHYALSGIAAFLCIRTLTRSSTFGLLVAACVFLMSPLAFSNIGELRIHASGLAYHMLSWASFAFFIKEPKKGRLLWLLFSGLAPWAHVFAMYGVSIQISIFIWILIFKDRHLPFKISYELYAKKSLRIATILTINLFTSIAFFLRYMQRGAETHKESWVSHIGQGIAFFSEKLLYPSALFWLALILLAAWLSRRSNEAFLKRRALAFGFIFSQFIFGALLSAQFLSTGYRDGSVIPRYVTPSLPPLIFGLGLLFSELKIAFSKTQRIWIHAAVIVGVWVSMAALCMPRYPSAQTTSSEPFKEIRKRIFEFDVQSQIRFVSGVDSKGDHSLATHHQGAFWGHTWQVYAKGPLNISSIRDYEKTHFGGLRGVTCDIARTWPELLSPNQARPHGILVDFCDLQNFKLRISPSIDAGTL